MERISFVIVLLFVVSQAFSQEIEEKEPKNLLTGSFGYTYISEGSAEASMEADGVFVPAIGLDYFRRIHPKWEIGTMIDFELGEYIIAKRDLNRHYALVLSGLVAYNLTNNITIYAGGGVELEKHQNFGIGRFGCEYEFEIKGDWVLSPGFFYDLKRGYDSSSISVAFGKKF